MCSNLPLFMKSSLKSQIIYDVVLHKVRSLHWFVFKWRNLLKSFTVVTNVAATCLRCLFVFLVVDEEKNHHFIWNPYTKMWLPPHLFCSSLYHPPWHQQDCFLENYKTANKVSLWMVFHPCGRRFALTAKYTECITRAILRNNNCMDCVTGCYSTLSLFFCYLPPTLFPPVQQIITPVLPAWRRWREGPANIHPLQLRECAPHHADVHRLDVHHSRHAARL